MRKRSLLLFLLLLGSIHLFGQYQNLLEYETENGVAHLVFCPKHVKGRMVVPDSVKFSGQYYEVVKLGGFLSTSFSGCRGITEIVLPNTIKKIGRESFKGCVRLNKINIPSSVTEIDYSAFSNCESLVEVDIPQSISEIAFNTFSGCKSLQKVNFQFANSIKNIGGNAFEKCSSLETFEIPPFLTSISAGCFSECVSLRDIKFHERIKNISDRAFYGCDSLKSLVSPSSLESCWGYAFANCKSLRTVKFNSSVRFLGDGFFADCENLEEVDLTGIEEIRSKLFLNCKKLSRVDVPETVEWIAPSAFWGTSVQVLNVPLSVTGGLQYSEEYKEWTALKEINVDPKNTSFCSENGVLYNKNKTKLYRYPPQKEDATFQIPNTVKEIAPFAFYGNKHLTELKIPASVKVYGEGAFIECPQIKIVNE
jgi:hypothetical protein